MRSASGSFLFPFGTSLTTTDLVLVNSIGNGDSLDESRKNSVNFEFSINLDSRYDLENSVSEDIYGTAIDLGFRWCCRSRENYTIQPGSLTSTAFSDDSLEEILALTARHDALMNYYFLDSKNQVGSTVSIEDTWNSNAV